MVVHIGVVARCGELHYRWGVGVAGGEGERQLVAEPCIHSAFSTSDGGHPVEQVITIGEGRHARVTRRLNETCNMYFYMQNVVKFQNWRLP